MLLPVICSAGLGLSATMLLGQSIYSSPIDLVSVNITSFETCVDSCFIISSRFLDRPIDEKDCLMNAIIAMGSLSASARSFTRALDLMIVTDPGYSRVLIFVRRGQLKVCFLLWGFCHDIRSMLQGNNWKIPEFTLFWEGREVGFPSCRVSPFAPRSQ